MPATPKSSCSAVRGLRLTTTHATEKGRLLSRPFLFAPERDQAASRFSSVALVAVISAGRW